MGALERSLGAAMEAQRVSGTTFLSRFDIQGSVRSENREMLEFDDPLNGFAMFLLQNNSFVMFEYV